MDSSAVAEALRYGRAYPPIPYENPSLSNYSDVDLTSKLTTPEYRDPQTKYSLKEDAFWQDFNKHHPRPPEDITRRQLQTASDLWRLKHNLAKQNPQSHLTAQDIINNENLDRREALKAGLPEEAFSDEALFWAYVFKARQDYQTLIDSTKPSLKEQAVSNFIARQLYVDPKYVSLPFTDDQLQAANAWKIAYLNRLQRQNTDPSYINAYLKAWNLSVNVLSVGPKK
jgi:hypothetical protein